jgi:predicted nucleic acid-binding Zn ribbon protein
VDDNLPRPVGESIDRAAAALGAPRASALHSVFVCWTELVGPAIAAHARPLSLKDAVLTIGVDQPGWATQLRYLEPTLLAQLTVALGEGTVARVELRVVASG